MGASSSSLEGDGGVSASIEPKVLRTVFTTCSDARCRMESSAETLAGCGTGLFGNNDKSNTPRSITMVIPFLDTVSSGELDEVKEEIKKDPGVIQRSRDSKGNVATHVAAAAGHVAVLDALAKQEPELLWAKNEVGPPAGGIRGVQRH